MSPPIETTIALLAAGAAASVTSLEGDRAPWTPPPQPAKNEEKEKRFYFPREPLPVFKPKWWWDSDRLDARPVAWSLRNHPEEWKFKEGYIGKILVHIPSQHQFWVGSQPYRLHRAECSCHSHSRGKFHFGQHKIFKQAYRQWYARMIEPRHPTNIHEQFCSHFVHV